MTDPDHGRRPLAWSAPQPPAPPRITRAEIDRALLWDGLRHRAAAGDLWAQLQIASHDPNPSHHTTEPR